MTTATLAPPAASTSAFPAPAVEALLRGELLKAACSDAAIRGVAFPTEATAQAAASIQIDSLVVVSLLCSVEPTLGFELKDSVVKAGGYASVHQAVEHLMPRIEKAWEKNGGKK